MQRVLVLGTTGVRKKVALKNLEQYQINNHGDSRFKHFNLEEIILEKNGIPVYRYLDADVDRQNEYWSNGWSEFKTRLNSNQNDNIVLSMHSILARRLYGIRSPIKINRIVEEFKPTIIITLIDDVYLQWHRTHLRAGIRGYCGKPTLEQLLQARRSEIFLGDLLSKQVGKKPIDHPPHYVISVWHPARILDRIIFHKGTQTGYLSFPISKPRKLKLAADPSGEQEINHILTMMSDFESTEHHIAFFCPLTIDEYPLTAMLDTATPAATEICFETKNRWDVRTFYGRNTILLTDDSDLPREITIPKEEIVDARGMIKSDVGIRDYRLIEQSSFMAVFNPMFKGVSGECNFARGVYSEIVYATDNKPIPIEIYQNPIYDPQSKAVNSFKTASESMGGGTSGSDYISFHDDPETLIKAIKSIYTLVNR